MDKQPKGVKPASVHSLSSYTIDTTMAPVRLQCVVGGCHWRSLEMGYEHAWVFRIKHWQDVHPAAQLPTLKSGVDQAEWNYFEKEWEYYKKVAGMFNKIVTSADLWMCLDAELRDNLLCSDKNAKNMSEKRLITVVKKLALVKSFREHNSYMENSPTGFNANQSNQMLGTDLSETVVVGHEMVDLTNRVVAFDTRVVTNTEDCNGGSKNSLAGFNANQSNQMLGTDLSETVVVYEVVDSAAVW